MKIPDIRKKLVEYEALRLDENLYQSILDLPVTCQLRGVVPINGTPVEYAFNAPDDLVISKAQNKLADVRAKMSDIEAQFGITK